VGFPFFPSFVLSLDVCTIVLPHCLPVDIHVPVVLVAHHTCPFYRSLGPSRIGSHSLLLSQRVTYILLSTCPQIGHRTILPCFTVCCFLSALARAVPLASSHLDHHHHHPSPRLHAPLGSLLCALTVVNTAGLAWKPAASLTTGGNPSNLNVLRCPQWQVADVHGLLPQRPQLVMKRAQLVKV
jgi:hypothetical protein